MRTGPARDYPVFHVAEKGEVITILKSHTDWYKALKMTVASHCRNPLLTQPRKSSCYSQSVQSVSCWMVS
jgi:hypothetical protein